MLIKIWERQKPILLRSSPNFQKEADTATEKEKKKQRNKNIEKKHKSLSQKVNPNQIKFSKPPSWTQIPYFSFEGQQ